MSCSIRQFLHGSLMPLAALIGTELRRKLDIPDLTISFDKLGAMDLTGKARAYASLIGADMDDATARRLAGF